MRKKEYVLGFIFCLETDQVVLIEKKKPYWQAGYLNGIGGKVEWVGVGEMSALELPSEAMQREAREETSLYIGASNWKRVCSMIGERWIVHVFATAVSRGEFSTVKTMETEEVIVENLKNIHWRNNRLLGNIPWLINLSLDRMFNPDAFAAPDITYYEFSFPLLMLPDEKKQRTQIEHDIERNGFK